MIYSTCKIGRIFFLKFGDQKGMFTFNLLKEISLKIKLAKM